MGVSRECYSKPAAWVVAKRIRERQLGFRAEQVLRFIKERLEAGLPPPSLNIICDELGIDGKGNASRIRRSLQVRGCFVCNVEGKIVGINAPAFTLATERGSKQRATGRG